jgi:3-oxoacyl-[acyl-carrier protein] reductase
VKFAGKCGLVTGAGKGIGRAIALGLAAEGASVGILDVDEPGASRTAEEARCLGRDSRFFRCDVSSRDEVESAVAEALRWSGQIDFLVNNAGIQGAKAPFLDIAPVKWHRTQDVNVTGMFNMSQTVAKHMASRGHGRIVNVVSIAGLVFWKGNLAYDVSKGAVRSLTGALALELAPFGITVNGIAPGIVDTELNSETLATAEAREKAASEVPLGRIATPQDMVGPVLFLLSDEARYVTGTIITVDGGYSLTR